MLKGNTMNIRQKQKKHCIIIPIQSIETPARSSINSYPPVNVIQGGNWGNPPEISTLPIICVPDQDLKAVTNVRGCKQSKPIYQTPLESPVIVVNLYGVRLAGLVGLGAKVRWCRASVGEIAGENRLEDGAEDDLGTIGLRKRHPEHKHKLERVVEWEPIDGIDSTLENS